VAVAAFNALLRVARDQSETSDDDS